MFGTLTQISLLTVFVCHEHLIIYYTILKDQSFMFSSYMTWREHFAQGTPLSSTKQAIVPQLCILHDTTLGYFPSNKVAEPTNLS